VRVELIDPYTHEPLTSIRTRKELLREIARRIPLLESRINPPKLIQPTLQMQLGLEPIPPHIMQMLQIQQMQAQGIELVPVAPGPARSGKKGRKK
jgi:hypothetical protein